jgi:hypothetical protein
MRYPRAALVMAGLTLALIVPGSASALSLDVQLAPTAQLVAGGAAVDVPMTVTCDATGTADVFVNVTQRRGSHVVQGFGSSSLTCTGSAQTLVVRVPSGSDIVFKPKKRAVASAELFGCDATECGSDTDSEVIQILK